MVAVSIIIPCFNCENTIIETLDSLEHQNFKNFEVICIDNKSTDGSVETINRFKDQKNLSIKIISEPVKGPSAARNAGIRCASGDLIAFIDSDDLWVQEKLSRVVDIFERDPEVGLCHTAGSRINQDSEIGAPFHASLSVPDSYLYSLLVKNCIVTSTVVARKQILEQVGLFDETLLACEDLDLWIRVARITKISYVDEQLTLYRIHPSNTHQNIGLMEATRFAVQEKYAALLSHDAKALKYILLGRVEAHLSLSYKYRRSGQVIEAIRHAIRAIKISPMKLRAYKCVILAILAKFKLSWFRRSKMRTGQNNAELNR